jgi:hypothetical protein
VTTQQLALTLDADPVDVHAAAREVVRRAIETTAILHGGVVSPNAVRVRLTHTGVPSCVIGQTYRALRLEGRLIPDGWDTSDDVKGGNNGKPCRRYRWVAL